MNIIIAGDGEVGFHLAKMLHDERHDITVVDPHEDLLKMLESHTDILTITGDSPLFEESGGEEDAGTSGDAGAEGSREHTLLIGDLGDDCLGLRQRTQRADILLAGAPERLGGFLARSLGQQGLRIELPIEHQGVGVLCAFRRR